ncbi:CYTH domain-containing protein [uncultured Thiothrix sp.]|uniref:CYTH domain-containing protein n=1 Tax=uncultured Thiothrix sp. TaxID=223185 RepID=UPI00262B8879|nr:CYTH domain-containing protein [uncultured Thiothrix sp.]
MALEIEHKFLLISNEWRNLVSRSEVFRQGYLSNNPAASVRVRIADEQATLNIKGMTIGTHRPEYEYSIPLQDAAELLDLLCARPIIEKTRHFVEYAGKTWEIDEFAGENTGLLVAEVELAEIGEHFQRPTWAGIDVSGIERYYNVSLLKYPYQQWTAAEKAYGA